MTKLSKKIVASIAACAMVVSTAISVSAATATCPPHDKLIRGSLINVSTTAIPSHQYEYTPGVFKTCTQTGYLRTYEAHCSKCGTKNTGTQTETSVIHSSCGK